MARMSNATMERVRLDPPELVPINYDFVNPGGSEIDRTCRLPQAPDTENRQLFADRAHVFFIPDASYANIDVQKGGAPGEGIITSQTEQGATVVGGIPRSPLKFTFAMADWDFTNPVPLPAHAKISLRPNPNSAISKIGVWANEGTPSNTNYESPAPWAAGIYIG